MNFIGEWNIFEMEMRDEDSIKVSLFPDLIIDLSTVFASMLI